MKLTDATVAGALGKPTPLAELLNDLAAYYRDYVFFGDAERDFLAVWTVMTHGYEAFRSVAYVLITSAEPESGKSTLGDLIARAAREGLKASNLTAAAAFRVIEKFKPTLIIARPIVCWAVARIRNSRRRSPGSSTTAIERTGTRSAASRPNTTPRSSPTSARRSSSASAAS